MNIRDWAFDTARTTASIYRDDDGRDDERDQFEPIECVSCGLEANALDATAAGFVYANDIDDDGDLLCSVCDAEAEKRKGCC